MAGIGSTDNEVIRVNDNSYVRAVGPMQFLPTTWVHHDSDGNGDGASDPNNVFDAALGAAQYLCSGGLDLRYPAAELRAVLRYNNSMSYASDVLSWAASYDVFEPPMINIPELPPIRAGSSVHPPARRVEGRLHRYCLRPH